MGTYVDNFELIDKLRLFSVANGWTEVDNSAETIGNRVFLSKNGVNAVLLAVTDGKNVYTRPRLGAVFVYCASSFDIALPYNSQPGASTIPPMMHNVGAGTYYFFANSAPEMIYCVVEYSPTHFQHASFGELVGYSYTPTFYHASNYHHQAYNTSYPPQRDALRSNSGFFDDYSSSSLNQTSFSLHDGAFKGCVNSYGIDYLSSVRYFNRFYWDINVNTLNSLNTLVTINVFSGENSSYATPIGFHKHVKHINMKGLSDAKTYNYGSQEWVVFPWHKRGAKVYPDYIETGDAGVAIRKT